MNCPECKQTFTAKRSLTRHVKTKHEMTEDSNYTCEHCNKVIKRKDNYEKHKQNCEKKYIHICDKCDKKFVYIKALKNHLNEHWDEDVDFFPIKNDIDNSITVTSDKNP